MAFKKLSPKEKAELDGMLHEGYAIVGYFALILAGIPPVNAANEAHKGAEAMFKHSKVKDLL